MQPFIDNQSIIITLDPDGLLFDKLRQVEQAGYNVVEINSCDTSLLSRAIRDFPKLRIGAGNIVNTQQLEQCYQAGVHFATSPGFLPAIAQTAQVYGMNFLPGIASISEAMHAMSLGIHHVRPYPATLGLCTILNKSLPLLRLFPAEVEWDETEHFLNLPAVVAVSILNPEVNVLHRQPEKA